MDNFKKDGTIIKDRAKANVYIDLYEGNMHDFHFDTNEVTGLVKVKATDAFKLFKNQINKIPATIIKPNQDEHITITTKDVTIKEFLVNSNETAYGKYGDILNKIIELTN